jgi:hypothetical protein
MNNYNGCDCDEHRAETGQLTETEAETLAVMLTSATRKMAKVRDDKGYVWENPYRAIHDMCQGFYEIAPLAVYGVCI